MMRSIPSVLAVCLLALQPGCSGKAQNEQSQKDQAALQGEWEIVSAESNDESPPADLLRGALLQKSQDHKLVKVGSTLSSPAYPLAEYCNTAP